MSAYRVRIKTIIYVLVVNTVLVLLLCLIGEFALRWYIEGGFRSAVVSVVSRRTPASYLGTNNWLISDPDLGYKLNPWKDGVNAFGIRHANIPVDKPDGLWRLIVLGDSVAWDTDGFVTLLREELVGRQPRPIEVINAAIPGYTTYQERLLLERDLLPLHPDVVILQYCVNDNHRFLHHLTEDGKWLITQEAKQALLVQGSEWLSSLSQSSYLVLELRRRLLQRRMRAPGLFPWEGDAGYFRAWEDESWGEFNAHLLGMRDKLQQIGARLMVLAVPYKPQLDQALLDQDARYTLKPQRWLARLTTEAGVPWLDLFPAFMAHREQPLYRDDVHLTSVGHALVVQELWQFLDRQGLLARPEDGVLPSHTDRPSKRSGPPG
jgi:lysophospholipase L1-like esterase